MIQIKGQYEFTDFKNAQRLHAKSGKQLSWFDYSITGFFLLTILGGLILGTVGSWAWIIIILFVIFIVWLVIVQYVVGPRRMLQIFNQQKDLSTPLEIELADEGFESHNEYGSFRAPWRDFVKWKEDANLLMLYRSDVMFHMLPKRFFHNDQELEFVREKLRQSNVPDANPVSKPSRARVALLILLAIFITALVIYQLQQRTIH